MRPSGSKRRHNFQAHVTHVDAGPPAGMSRVASALSKRLVDSMYIGPPEWSCDVDVA